MSATLRIGQRLAPSRAAVGAAADPTAVRDELLLALTITGLLAAVTLLALAHAGSVARPLFMLSALGICVVAKRRSPWLYLSASLWIWLVTSFARRMMEWHSGFIAIDIVLITPNLTALLIVPDMLGTPGMLRRRGVGYALLLFASAVYGLCVSFVGGNVLGGAIAAADWLVPLLYLFLFICHAERIDEAEHHFGTLMPLTMIFVVPYSLYQYFWMPDWDAAWMLGSGFGSVGHPLPMESHVFGPLNNPGFLAVWLGTCLVLLSHFRSRLLLVMTPFIFLLLLLTMVRSVYGSTILAMAVGALVGRGGFGRLATIVLIAGLSGYVGAAALNPQVLDSITVRLQSMQHLSDDGSAQARAYVYANTPKYIDENPFGTGIGSQGRGAIASVGKTVASVDSGPLSVLLALGWVAGPLYVIGMTLLAYRAMLVGRTHNSSMAAAMAAASICPLGIFPFINILSFSGVVLWVCLGYVMAIEIRATSLRSEY